MKIYTKTGDSGETSLFGGTRIKKTDERIQAHGHIDELNAQLGLAIATVGSHPQLESVKEILRPIQHQLFVLGSHLATPYTNGNTPDSLPTFEEGFVEQLEQLIDALEESLTTLKTFILPGGHPAAAQLHLARTVCRRAERAVVALAHNQEILPAIMRYLNRLSDLLFVLARSVNAKTGNPETEWVAE